MAREHSLTPLAIQWGRWYPARITSSNRAFENASAKHLQHPLRLQVHVITTRVSSTHRTRDPCVKYSLTGHRSHRRSVAQRGRMLAARAAGLTPMGLIGTVADFSDAEAYRAVVRHSAKFGFEGASCIHPANVAVLNEEFSPKPEAVAHARRIVEGDKQAIAEGRGSWSLDGKMIDIPVVIRAQRLIARADRIAARGNV